MKHRARRSGRSGTVPFVTEPAALSREAFIAAALQIIDEDGPEALTLKGLGTFLGVSHTAIYRYFNDIPSLIEAVRADLLVQMAGAKLKSPEPRGRIIEFALRFRSVINEHPNFAPLFGTVSEDVSALVPPSLLVVEELERLGVKGDLLSQGYQALEAYVVGGTVWDYAGAPHHHRTRQMRFRLVRHKDFDRITRDEKSLAKNTEAAFVVGLECLLDGLIARK
jgi:AcrR family transcriptional regulator